MNWWKRLTKVDIRTSDHLKLCLLFGFPGDAPLITALNYCILVAKYFIYSNKMNDNNQFDFYSYLALLKQKLMMEEQASSKKCNMLEYILSKL